jgi:capsular polysaccharide export protein
MSPALKKRGYEYIILSNKLSIIIKCLLHNYSFYIIRKTYKKKIIPDLSCCYDLKSSQSSYADAEILYSSIIKAFEKVSEKEKIDLIFIWNGLSIQTLAVSDFAKKEKIKTRYFELANIPEKLFVDPYGVNARSSLFKDTKRLEDYPVEEKHFQNWKDQFIVKRKTQIDLPQTTNARKIQNYAFIIDLLGFTFLNLPQNGETNLRRKIKHYFCRKLSLEYDVYDYKSREYIFLPLQVSLDTQLLFNSDVDNLSAIKAAKNKAEELKSDLVVKIHPSEESEEFIKDLFELRKQVFFYIVNYNTIELIMYSILIITINSTAGLESMILGKNTIFLGRSFYPLLKNHLLRNYLLGYLVDASFFGKSKVSDSAIDHILRKDN